MLEDEKTSKLRLEEKVESVEHKCSALQLDLKQKAAELTSLNQQLKEIEDQLENESDLRFQAQSSVKREKERMREEIEALEQDHREKVGVVII